MPSSRKTSPSHRAWLALALLLIVAALLLTHQLNLPGLHNDEAQEAGLQAIQLLTGRPVTAFRGIGLGPPPYPLMVQDYIGALHVYLALPFFTLLGPTTVALRLMSVVVALAILVVLWAFARAAFDSPTALLTLLLLIPHPSWVFWYRQGVFIMSLNTLALVVALYLLHRWGQRGGWPLAFALGLTLGLGLYAKLLFLWVIGGLLAALALRNLAPLLTAIRQRATPTLWPRTPTPADLLATTLGGLVGLIPLLLYNLRSAGTFLSIFDNLGTSYYGVNNADIAANLATRLQSAREVLLGVQFWYLGGSYSADLWPPLFVLALLGVIVWVWQRWPAADWASLVAVTLLVGLLQSVFTVSGLFHTHLAMFVPLPALLTAAILVRLARQFKHFVSLAPFITAAFAALLALTSLFATARYYGELDRTGGLGVHADAIDRLIPALEDYATGPVVALDWGFAPQVRQLTADRIQPTEVFGYQWQTDPDFANRLTPFFQNHETLYILHWDNEEVFPRRADFFTLAAQHGLAPTQLAIIARRDGAPVFELIRLAPP